MLSRVNRQADPSGSRLAKHLGSTVRRFREKQGWSQELLAERADLNRSYVGELERGEAIASLVTLEKLAAAFGIGASQLLTHAERTAQMHTAAGIQLTSIAC